jgi:CubicO group peptidase (beta-lactamase class C family)
MPYHESEIVMARAFVLSPLVAVVALLPCLSSEPGPGQKAATPTDLAAALEPIRKQHDLPALAALVILDGKVVALGATGVRKQGRDVAVTAQDQFHLGSCTKAMTCSLIAILVEEGKLSWTTPIGKGLPSLVKAIHPDWRTVTLEMLLSHHAGLPHDSWPPGMTFQSVHALPGTPRQQRLAYAERMLKDAPKNKPGMKYEYANAGYAIAGAIAEHATNTSWEELIQQRLFKPLGIKGAGFGSMGTPGKLDQPVQHFIQNGKRRAIDPGPLSDNPPAIGPAGTVHMPLPDWARYINAHLQGLRGQNNILKAQTYNKLHTRLFNSDYALGWYVARRPWGGIVYNHAGSNNQNYCVVWMSPEKNFAVLVATNIGGDDAIGKAVDEAAWKLIQQYLRP